MFGGVPIVSMPFPQNPLPPTHFSTQTGIPSLVKNRPSKFPKCSQCFGPPSKVKVIQGRIPHPVMSQGWLPRLQELVRFRTWRSVTRVMFCVLLGVKNNLVVGCWLLLLLLLLLFYFLFEESPEKNISRNSWRFFFGGGGGGAGTSRNASG